MRDRIAETLRIVVYVASVAWLLTLAVALLSGCSYTEMLSRPPKQDTRIKVDNRTRIFINARDQDDYTCYDERAILYCRTWGSKSMCTCETQVILP